MMPSVISVYIIGPEEKSVSSLIAKFQETREASGGSLIDNVWKKGKISSNHDDIRRQIFNEKRNFGKFYFSKGSIIDIVAASDIDVPSADGGLSSAQTKKIILPLVKCNDETDKLLVRLRRSLVVLVNAITETKARNEHDPTHRYISILRCLRVPFHHLKQADVVIQADILKKAVQAGKLPSPFSSLTYFEQLSSKPKKMKGKNKQESNDLATFYKNINLPFYWDQNKALSKKGSLRSIVLDDSDMIQVVEHQQRGKTNRFLEKFLEVRGITSDLFLLQFDRCIPSKVVVEMLKDGMYIQGDLYSFLGCSTSGLKKRKAVLIKGTNEDAHNERQTYGDFASIKTVSKQISRFSLLLSNIIQTSVKPMRILKECDVESKTANYTDGCGRISPDLAAALYKESKPFLARRSEDHVSSSVPSVFQIRFQGYKGVVTKDSALENGTILLRPSMKKFVTDSFPHVCLCDYSRPYNIGHLNRQFITLLSGLGVPDEAFIQIQQEHFGLVKNMTSDHDSALQILEWRDNHAGDLINNDDNIKNHLCHLKPIQSQLIKESPKLKILIPESRTLFGVAEPPKFDRSGYRQPGVLQYGECLVRVTMKGGHKLSLQNQKVVVSKNPCYLVGDIRVLKAVSSYERPELKALERDLVDCVVFPIEGKNAHSAEIAGSDLDGDQYFVCWDKRIIPLHVSDPYTYPAFSIKNTKKGPASAIDLISYFSRQNTVSDLTGRVDSNYRAWANMKGSTCFQCVRLGQLFSRVVDSAKSGERIKIEDSLLVPRQSRTSPSACSKFVWQKLEHYANCFVEGQLKTGNFRVDGLEIDSTGNGEHDYEEYISEDSRDGDDIFHSLVERNHLSMSEFTKFRLIMRHMGGNIHNFFHSRYAAHVNFAYFSDSELGFAVSFLNVPEAAVCNALKYFSRITYMHTAFMNKFVAHDRAPWKLYWRSESRTGTHHFSRMLMHSLRENTDALLFLKLPDSVVVILRFAHHTIKSSHKSALFTNDGDCIEKDLRGFLAINAVLLSDHYNYVEEYTLEDQQYKIDISGKSLQLYRGKRGATFIHLKMDSRDSIHDITEQLQISVDLTRFNRRILNGQRRHPLIRKAPVFDMELFVSNRSTLHAMQPSNISHVDILLEDGEDWKVATIPSQKRILDSDWEAELLLYQKGTSGILKVIEEEFHLGASSHDDPKSLLLSFMEKVIYPSHQLYGSSDRIPSVLKNKIESLTLEMIYAASSFFDKEEKMMILNLLPLLSDLGIIMTAKQVSTSANDMEAATFVSLIRRWDFWMALRDKSGALAYLQAESSTFALKNAVEQARILFHDLEEGGEEVRSSKSVSRLVNLLIDCQPHDPPTESRRRKNKTPVITLYGVQAIPAGLRFVRGEYVCLLKQPVGAQEITHKVTYSTDWKEGYDTEFPALRDASEQTTNQSCFNDYEPKHAGFCVGRVVSVIDAPFSIKVKLIAPSYSLPSNVPELIKDCLVQHRDVYWELQMIPANVVAHERIMDSIALLLEPKEKLNRYLNPELCSYLMASGSGSSRGSNLSKEDHEILSSAGKKLNPHQQEAVSKSMKNVLTLVHGPPGTGKSTTITGIIEEILATECDSHRTLVVAETNLAVDNLALRMMSSCDKMVRVGSGEKVHAELKLMHLEAIVKGRISSKSVHAGDAEQDFYLSKHTKVMNEVLSDTRVVFATCIGAGDPILDGHTFDSVVIDEASMSTEPGSLCALSRGCSRLVLVGDHKQLGPHACGSKCISLFERLISEAESNIIHVPIIMLSQQHRMHSKLCQFPSSTFYDGKLLTVHGIDKERSTPSVVFGGKSPLKFVPVNNGREQRMTSGSWYNEVEVGLVLDMIKKLTKEDNGKNAIHPAHITVLTPYRAQQARIQLQLKNIWNGDVDQPPEVCSIDGYQGRENEIIVFSAVRCGSLLGFCDDERRINVLLTRAKCGLVVIGDRQTLKKSSIWNKWINTAEFSGDRQRGGSNRELNS